MKADVASVAVVALAIMIPIARAAPPAQRAIGQEGAPPHKADQALVKELLRQAHDCAPAIADPLERARLLEQLALAYAKAGEKQEAVTAISDALSSLGAIKDGTARDPALVTISESQSRLGMLEAAIATAEEIDAEGIKSIALGNIANALAANGRMDEARNIVDRIDDAFFRDAALCFVAEAAAERGDLEHVRPKSWWCSSYLVVAGWRKRIRHA